MSGPPSSAADPVGSVGIIGLGIMGGAIAANLLRAGFAVRGFDPDGTRAAAAREFGVTPAKSAGDCAAGCRVLLTSLPSNAALDATVDTLLAARAHLPATLDVIELSTLSLDCKERARARLAAQGLTLVDCPVSGTGAQARTGDLVLYASGDPAAVERSRDVLQGFARAAHYVGAFGNGMRLKLVANLLVAVHNVATAEALAMARRIGIDPAQACELLGGGVGASRILALRGPMMASGTFEPATMKLDVWQKDLDLIAALARESGANTPLFSATLPLYAAALDAGLGHQDTAAVYRAVDGSLPEP